MRKLIFGLICGVVALLVYFPAREDIAIWPHGPQVPPWDDFLPPLRAFFPLILSTLLLATSLFVILSTRYGPKDKHWAYGTVGTLIGYWLHP